ncbi:hypothetical protein D0T50_09645 [Bacteroides sp. 214]|uniref:DUF5687 family protein n=1 Tax=Bacteroides sp. 214 TaxID=2302935 RepID=UPI0013D8705D|nr:DUF5687 family protein [Bacteroides sp. 214]NDW13156.1 hypothetical protein [Bacteroides sp. 214]
MLFNELRKHSKLAAKRHPMYDKNKFGKYFAYFMAVFWIGYLIFFGVTFAKGFANAAPSIEPYHVMNKGLIYVLILDFFMRFSFQKTPTQEMKPYLLLPIKRKRLIDFLLIRSGISGFNYLWLFMFVPFALLTITRFYGIAGVFTYVLGIYLLILLNNYWYLFCRTLFNENFWWLLLPVSIYGALLGVEFAFDFPFADFTMNLGEGFIDGDILYFLGVIACIALMWFINRSIILRFAYSELNKVEDTKVMTVSEYKFFERYGELGEYLRLELKMLFRNKRCKVSLRTIAIIVVFFSLILSFSDAYDGMFMKNFISIYSFVAFGTVILTQIMGFEGNYIDGLMTRKESIYTLLRAKYYFYCIMVIIPFILMIPAVVMGKLSLLGTFALAFLSIGPVYFCLFQMAVYNNKTVPLNEGVTGRQSSGTGLQNIISICSFMIPILLVYLLNALFGETVALWILLFIGIAFVATADFWIKNIYNRFMARRYRNMEGFRDTK